MLVVAAIAASDAARPRKTKKNKGKMSMLTVTYSVTSKFFAGKGGKGEAHETVTPVVTYKDDTKVRMHSIHS
jgi:hypothetical protein